MSREGFIDARTAPHRPERRGAQDGNDPEAGNLADRHEITRALALQCDRSALPYEFNSPGGTVSSNVEPGNPLESHVVGPNFVLNLCSDGDFR